MKLEALFLTGCISAAMMAFAIPATAAAVQQCPAETPNSASQNWDFKGETNNLFQDIQSDARQALDHADQLQSYADHTGYTWDTHALQLDALKSEVNHMESKICRLETIRRVDAPWQQAEIDRIASTLRLMVDNTEDAILFGSDHQSGLWLGTYRKYTDNLYGEARDLARSVDSAVDHAHVSAGHEVKGAAGF
jgi:hypothetical protein